MSSMTELRMPELKVSVLVPQLTVQVTVSVMTLPMCRLSELSMLKMTRPVLTVPARHQQRQHQHPHLIPNKHVKLKNVTF